MKQFSYSTLATPTLNATVDEYLACGTRREDHDRDGHCDTCDVCRKSLCLTQLGTTRFEGSTYHTRCLIDSRQRAVANATLALQTAEEEFQRVIAKVATR